MVQDKKKFTTGNKTADTSKNLDNKKGQAHSDKDSARTGTMKDHNASHNPSKEKDMGTKRDVNTRK